MTRTAGTVLAADDDSDLRSLYRHWLADAYDVRTAADGADALGTVDAAVDVVVLDREMPRTDGVAVAREPDRRDIQPAVVMVSGVTPDVDLLDVPVDDYLQKPVDRAALLDRVSRARTAAEQPLPRRHLLSLDTRRRIVEAGAPTRDLTADADYQRAVETLASHEETLQAARCSVPAAAALGGRGDRSDQSESSLPKSP